MNYTQRIAALQAFKASVSVGSTTDNVSGLSSDVSGWTGTANTKFDDYIETVKSDCKMIAGYKEEFLAEIDTIISAIQTQYESEYNSYSYILTTTYDSKDAAKNKTYRLQAINNLIADESVKLALKARV